MNPPKEPKSFRYPRLYMRLKTTYCKYSSETFETVPSQSTADEVAEAIIINPKPDSMGCITEKTYVFTVETEDGYGFTQTAGFFFNDSRSSSGGAACWDNGTYKDPFKALEKAKFYAKTRGYETIFLGEIK